MIKRLHAFDMDATLLDSPMPEPGKEIWKKKKGVEYPHLGWWGKLESLDPEVFDIKLFDKVASLMREYSSDPESYVMILTNRLPKFESRISEILAENGIRVDRIDTKRDYKNKGQRLLYYINYFTISSASSELEEVNVFEDDDKNISELLQIRDQIDNAIDFNVYKADSGNLTLVTTSNKLVEIVNQELAKLVL